MASLRSFSVDELTTEISKLMLVINTCLYKLQNNKFWFDKCTPYFATFNREEEVYYTNLIEAIRLLHLVWKPPISTQLSYGWTEKTVFDAVGRNTDRTRLWFELKSKPN